MTPILSNLTRKHTCWLIIVFIISSLHVAAQKELSGNLNQPFAKVTAIVAPDQIDVDDVTGFAIGDTILIIQIQGALIYTPTPLYGVYDNKRGSPGGHEFLIIENITGNSLTFSSNLINTYDPDSNVQIVRVPYYNSAVVTGKLFTDAWDPGVGKGGVLALIIGRSIRLDDDIDLTALGLRGAAATFGDGREQMELPLTLDDSYPLGFTNAGLKGEGIALHDKDGILLHPGHAKGQGPNLTGGGGGNGRFSGGGGGSHRGEGGKGGFEFMAGGVGGIGGKSINSTILANTGIFMGGGGGGSTSNSGPGGNGGGIVIIVTDTIIGNGGRILVNGDKGGDAVPGGGAGGAGAGGSIAISLTSFGPAGNTLTLQAKGGNGGENPAAFGEGGGGGGGLIYLSTAASPNVNIELTGGLPGPTIPVDGLGVKKEDFDAVLNGFLFNSIRSSVSGTQTDIICSDSDPPIITGTKPVGGTGTYSYTWQISTDDVTWNPIAGALSQDYDPGVDFDPELVAISSVYYRRIVTDGILTDISKSVRFIIQPYIKDNTIGADQIKCYNQDPDALVSTGTLAGGDGSYAFKWESSPDDITFGVAPGASASEGYDPSALIADTWYRRTVTSGRCVDISASVNIEVLPDISNNTIISAPQDICFGTTFNNLVGSKTAATVPVLGGGDDTYRFKWESNINGTGWSDASGVNNSPDYNPEELAQRIPLNEYHFRRVVKSGTGDVCSSVSNTVILRDYPQITNNTISGDQTICSGVVPAEVQGSDPANGDGTYTYTWQSSTKANGWTWTDIPGFINSGSASFQALALADTVLYRRIVMSSACTDISSSVTINVHKPVTNFGINTLSLSSDTTICNGQNPNIIKGGISAGGTNLPASFVYQWYMSADNASFDPVSSGGTSVDYDPPSLTQTTYYRRESVSGACSVNSNVVTVSVLPLISNNTITSDQVICFNTAPAVLTGPALSGGSGIYSYTWEESTDGGNTWIQASGNYNDPTGDYAPPALTIPIKYRRQVKSGLAGCCTNTSQVIDITLHPALPTARIVNADTTIYSGTPVEVMLDLTGSGPWDVTLNENSVPGAATRVDNNRSVVTVYPQAGSDLYTYVLSAVEDKNGCIATDIAGQLIAHIFGGPEVPEGFSPNGDGINDLLMVKGVNPDPGYQLVDLRILTSSGSEVFHTTNYAGQEWQEWDGNDLSGKPLPEGTYYYLLKVNTVLNNISYKESGFIILKRY